MIDQRNFNRTIKKLSSEKLVKETVLPDGSFCLKLTKKGKWEARVLDLMGSTINFKKPKKMGWKMASGFFRYSGKREAI